MPIKRPSDAHSWANHSQWGSGCLADSQGTSPVLWGDDLKPELSALFPESVLSALHGFFVAAVKGLRFCSSQRDGVRWTTPRQALR